MSYWDELPFGIISSNDYLSIETMNYIFSHDQNEMALFEGACEKYYEETPKDYVSWVNKLLQQNR